MAYKNKEEMWGNLIGEIAESGKSQAEWCKEKGKSICEFKRIIN